MLFKEKEQLIAYIFSRVARILQMGGELFWKFDTTVNELDPNFH